MRPLQILQTLRGMALALAALSLVSDLAAQATRGTTRRSTTTRSLGSRSSSGDTRQYRSNTMLGDALIEIDPETRSLIIITDDDTHQEISKVIKELDQPKPQVLIKVLFLEVTHRDGSDLGVEGKYSYQHGGINQGTVETVWGLAQQLDGGFWSLAADDWEITLRALAEQGKLEVLSRPSILARNNQEAVIIVGEEVPFVTNSRISDQGSTINTIQYADIGIILRVTPFITSEGLVEMIVAPEISTLTDQTIPISETVSSPVIAKRSAETVVVTLDGQTVVIGGLMESQKTEAVRKIPILGDIPLLGFAFRRTIKEDTKKELLIFLTPYIVEKPDDLGELSKREAGKARMAPGAFPEKELEKYLDGMKLENTDKP